MTEVQERLAQYGGMLEKAFDEVFPQEGKASYQTIYEAMRYSFQAGGKRLRPALTLEFCRVCGGEVATALPFALAVEMVHTYSLIHDDLPCMDDDDLRRGKPTSHKVFGEGMAVLTGDALLTEAMLVICSASGADGAVKAAAVRELSRCAGASGMIGGQVIDLQSEGKHITLSLLEELQTLKTCALLEAACRLGCMAAGKISGAELEAAAAYANNLGRAFQIQDDILDIEGDSVLLGKTIGKDAEHEKSTFPSLLGLEKCRELVRSHTDAAKQAVHQFEQHTFLKELAESMAFRKK